MTVVHSYPQIQISNNCCEMSDIVMRISLKTVATNPRRTPSRCTFTPPVIKANNQLLKFVVGFSLNQYVFILRPFEERV